MQVAETTDGEDARRADPAFQLLLEREYDPGNHCYRHRNHDFPTRDVAPYEAPHRRDLHRREKGEKQIWSRQQRLKRNVTSAQITQF